MTKVGEKLKGFGFGLLMAGVAMLSSSSTQATQGLCTGACQSCGACGLTVIPVILWIAAKSRGRIARFRPLNGKLPAHLAAGSSRRVFSQTAGIDQK